MSLHPSHAVHLSRSRCCWPSQPRTRRLQTMNGSMALHTTLDGWEKLLPQQTLLRSPQCATPAPASHLFASYSPVTGSLFQVPAPCDVTASSAVYNVLSTPEC